MADFTLDSLSSLLRVARRAIYADRIRFTGAIEVELVPLPPEPPALLLIPQKNSVDCIVDLTSYCGDDNEFGRHATETTRNPLGVVRGDRSNRPQSER